MALQKKNTLLEVICDAEYSDPIFRLEVAQNGYSKPKKRTYLRWYGTPVNINMDKSTLKAKYFHRLEFDKKCAVNFFIKVNPRQDSY